MDESPTVAPSATPAGGAAVARGRLAPGAILQDRYRIVASLGAGGMGQVYRADDLKLDHPVALKFLPPDRAFDPAWLSRFHNEVRVARQVSHPAVCRIFDIGEADGGHFLSMEYVDGEDLASLLRRIGRLPPDKGTEIARQLCAGLAAAHDAGVLHRDLKPANVMIDGRGRVKIADFGLAEFAARLPGGEIAGTPAYMAPEILRGGTATVASDLYALGLVLYEIFTGRHAKTNMPSGAEAVGPVRDGPPAAPSTVVRDIDPAIERVILRCLETDAAKRPASALAVAAGLPGSDPIAAALAAGETPSPEMVAAAGGSGALARPVAWGLAAAAIASVLFFAAANTFYLYRLVPLDKPPEVLVEQARAVLARAGLAGTPADRLYGFQSDAEFLAFVAKRQLGPAASDALVRSGTPPAGTFWYREAPVDMTGSDPIRRPTLVDPPMTVAGMSAVVIDTSGRLLELTWVPPRVDTAAADATPPAPPWPALFDAAGLDMKAFQAATPGWSPPTYADARAAWEGPLPGLEGERLRVEAASFHGRPVWFKLVSPWTVPPSGLLNAPLVPQSAAVQWLVAALLLLIAVAATLLTRRNLRSGRGDRRGAFAIAVAVFVAQMAASLFGLHHVASVGTEGELVFAGLSESIFEAVTLWAFYLALEPYVRRRWPDLIVSWARLLAGRVRDPLVGRDILIGAALGGAAVALSLASELLSRRFGHPGFSFGASRLDDSSMLGVGSRIALLGSLVKVAMETSLLYTFLLTLLTMIFRRRFVAVPLFFALVFTIFGGFGGDGGALELLGGLVLPSMLTLLVTRFGLLATAAMFLVFVIPSAYAMTLQASAWYFGATIFALTTIAAIVGYGLYTCLGGQPFAGIRLIEDS